jgi:hypothetical protein
VKAVHDGAKVGVDNPTQVQVFHLLGLEGSTLLVGKKSEAIGAPLEDVRVVLQIRSAEQRAEGHGGECRWFGPAPLKESICMLALSSEAEDVAIKMASTSEDFIHGLFRFMVHEYERQAASSTLTMTKNWLLIQRLV